MTRPHDFEYLTDKEKKAVIEAALAGGMEPAEVFKAVLQNEYGVDKRKNLVIAWGKRMGLEANESLRIAQGANLIRSVRKPSGPPEGKPPRKTPGKTGG